MGDMRHNEDDTHQRRGYSQGSFWLFFKSKAFITEIKYGGKTLHLWRCQSADIILGSGRVDNVGLMGRPCGCVIIEGFMDDNGKTKMLLNRCVRSSDQVAGFCNMVRDCFLQQWQQQSYLISIENIHSRLLATD